MTMIAVEPGGRFTEVPALITPAAAPPHAEPAGPGAHLELGAGVLGLEIFGQLEAGMRRVADSLDRDYRHRLSLAQAIYPVPIDPIPLPLTGTLDLPQLLRPTLGRYWDVKLISMSGATAGTVTVFINAPGLGATRGTITGAAAAPPPLTFGKGQCVLRGNADRLVFVTNGITGNPVVSLEVMHVAEEFAGEYFR